MARLARRITHCRHIPQMLAQRSGRCRRDIVRAGDDHEPAFEKSILIEVRVFAYAPDAFAHVHEQHAIRSRTTLHSSIVEANTLSRIPRGSAASVTISTLRPSKTHASTFLPPSRGAALLSALLTSHRCLSTMKALTVSFRLLSTLPRIDALTFGYAVVANSDADFHRADLAPSRTHDARLPGNDIGSRQRHQGRTKMLHNNGDKHAP